jgi:serine/arginine repetitive matrix protein 2
LRISTSTRTNCIIGNPYDDNGLFARYPFIEFTCADGVSDVLLELQPATPLLRLERTIGQHARLSRTPTTHNKLRREVARTHHTTPAMWNKITGKSSESSSQSGRQRKSDSSSSRKRAAAESVVSSSSTRRPKDDDEDKPRRTTSRTYTYPAAPESTASSYATAPSQRDRGVGDEKPKRRATMDDERPYYYENQQSWSKPERAESRERSDKTSSRRERSRSLDREERRKERRERREKEGKRRTGERGVTRSETGESTRAGETSASFSAQVAGGGFSQFPGQEGAPATGYATGDSHVAHQFPGQDTAPYRPVAGAAAEYYGDQGQSVLQQPGVRPASPLVNAQPHLVSASAQPAPPQETGHGAADDYFGGVAATQTSTPTKPSRPSSKPGSASKPSNGGKISSTAAVAGGAALGYAAAHASGHSEHSTSHSQNGQQYTASGALNGASGMASYQLEQATHHGHSLSAPNGGSISISPGHSPRVSPSHSPSRPGKSHAGAYAAGAAGLAAGAYALHQHHEHQHEHHQSASMSASGDLYGSASYGPGGRPPLQNGHGHSSYMAQQHKHRGPVTKFVDWWKDYEDVLNMEEYTEYIGVCRDCFDPRSTIYDAPRKHHYRKRKSRESLREKRSGEFRKSNEYLPSGRVDKESR